MEIKSFGVRLKKAENELIMRHTGYKEKINCLITQSIIDVFRSYSKNDNRESIKMEAIRSEMLKKFDYDRTLAELASMAGYSESYFSALCKKALTYHQRRN